MDRAFAEGTERGAASTRHPGRERPRVLVVATRLGPGGVTSQVLAQATGLRGFGYDARLVWGAAAQDRSGSQPPSDLATTHIPWLGRDLHPLDDLHAAAVIDGIVRRWRPDIVHTHLSKAGALTRPVARRARVPVIVHTFHGPVIREDRSALRNLAFSKVERVLGASTSALIAVASDLRDELLGAGIGQPSRWHVVAPGVDPSRFASESPTPAEARSRLGLRRRGRVVGVSGHLSAGSDLGLVLRIVERIVRGREDVTIVIAGEGPARTVLEREAGALGDSRIRFVGRTDEDVNYLRACDVVLVTPSSESVPVAAIVAAAAGLPIVTIGSGSMRTIVQHGETGLIVPRGGEPTMSASTLELLADPRRARALGVAGAAWVRGRFTRRRLVEETATLYATLLGPARARGLAAAERRG